MPTIKGFNSKTDADKIKNLIFKSEEEEEENDESDA